MPRRARPTRTRHPWVTGLYVGTPLVSLFVFRAPLLTTGLVCLASVAIFAAFAPAAFLASAALLTAAVPKAGFVVGGLPLPLMMFVLMLSALLLRGRADTDVARCGSRLAILALVWLAYRLAALFLNGGTPIDLAALAGWYGLPIVLLLAGPALGSLRPPMSRKWGRGLGTGVLVACGFSIVQQLGGIEETAVPGLTRAVGVDYSSKPLAFEGGSKIPSTYQNGNILGVVTAFFFLISADQVLRGRGTRRDMVIMAGAAAATLLSGSRTAVIALAVGLGALMLRSGMRRQTIAIASLCLFVAGITLYFSPALAQRLMGTSASDPALTVRTEVWSLVLDTTSPGALLTGGSAWANPESPAGLAEGMIGAVQQVGLIGLALFVGVFAVATSPPRLRRWRLLLIPLIISFAVDSAYLVFPTFFLPIARMFAPLDLVASPTAEHTSRRRADDLSPQVI